MRLSNRLLALRGVHDQGDLAVLDHVDYVRTALAHLVDPGARHAGARERLGGTARRYDLEPAFHELSTELDRGRLVAISHAQEHDARAWQIDAGRDLRLRVSLREGPAGAHDLARRLHLRTEDRIRVRELDERKKGFLHREVGP